MRTSTVNLACKKPRFVLSCFGTSNLNLVATAVKGETGNVKGEGGNITIQGSDIKGGNNISLAADNTINLLADKSTASQVSHSTSSSSGVGVGASFGTNGAAVGVTANAAASRGNADGNDVTYTNTHLDAGNQLSIKSGGDTNLKGAVANGKQIIADIGGNLNIESLQDTSVYASANTSMSGSVTAGIGFSASGSYSQSNINGNYASVQEQSGLKSGDGGFQVNVKGNTNLKGAVIESTRAATDAGLNTLSTATLTTSDIQNQAEYDAQSVNVSTSGAPTALNANDSTRSTTRSGISGASITITDDAKQKQLTGQSAQETIASLNREVSTGQDTSGAISNNLDVQEIQTGMTVTQAFVQQAGTFVANQAQKSDNLKAAGDAKKAEADKEPDPVRKQQLLADAQNLYQQSEATAADSKLWQPGGTYRQIATALTAAAGGNVTGGTAQLMQGAAVNYIQSLGAEQVKHIADTLLDDNGKETTASTAVRAALHAIVACSGANAQGSDCGSAALGASAGSLINSIMGGDPATMTAKEKENRTNLVATLVTGIAATTDASNIAAATSSAVIETENNAVGAVALTAGRIAVGGIIYTAEKCVTNPVCRQKALESGMISVVTLAKAMGLASDNPTDAGKPGDPLPIDPPLITPNNGSQLGTILVNPGDTQPAEGAPGYNAADPATTRGSTHVTPNDGPQGATVIESRGRLPITGIVTADNGLQVASNSKHTPGMPGSRANAGTEPQNSLDLFNNSIPDPNDPRTRYAVDSNGELHRFVGKNGPFHWSGGTGDARNPLPPQEVPIEVRRKFGY